MVNNLPRPNMNGQQMYQNRQIYNYNNQQPVNMQQRPIQNIQQNPQNIEQ